ncbi:hypothetical protein D3C77_355790 [compost metagenome]
MSYLYTIEMKLSKEQWTEQSKQENILKISSPLRNRLKNYTRMENRPLTATQPLLRRDSVNFCRIH